MDARRFSKQTTYARGVTLVESAIILLMFFTLLLGVVEAGRFLNMRQAVTNAAREGARFAIAPASKTSALPNQNEVAAVVDSYLAASNIDGATTTVRCPPSATESCIHDAAMAVRTGSVTTEYTEVTVTKPYSVITAPGIFKMLEVTLTGKAMMRRETSN
jgi:Flp pilus assembly protein TadG